MYDRFEGARRYLLAPLAVIGAVTAPYQSSANESIGSRSPSQAEPSIVAGKSPDSSGLTQASLTTNVNRSILAQSKTSETAASRGGIETNTQSPKTAPASQSGSAGKGLEVNNYHCLITINDEGKVSIIQQDESSTLGVRAEVIRGNGIGNLLVADYLEPGYAYTVKNDVPEKVVFKKGSSPTDAVIKNLIGANAVRGLMECGGPPKTINSNSFDTTAYRKATASDRRPK